MSCDKKAFEYAKDIVVAGMPKVAPNMNKKTGEDVAEFFESIFTKLVELEKANYSVAEDLSK